MDIFLEMYYRQEKENKELLIQADVLDEYNLKIQKSIIEKDSKKRFTGTSFN